eukprot:52741-Eustigmatos_ZCMA.PRE.1
MVASGLQCGRPLYPLVALLGLSCLASPARSRRSAAATCQSQRDVFVMPWIRPASPTTRLLRPATS